MSEQSELFFVKQVPRARNSHRDEVKSMKEKHGIFTYNCKGAGDWMAMSMPECVEKLKGYDLTDEEKTCGATLMAGYCRLLDESRMIEDGHKTEYEACRALVERIESK